MVGAGFPPIHIKTDESEPPEDGGPVQYILAENGLFRAVRMPLFEAVAKVEGGVRGLEPQEEQLKLKLPRIPQRLFELGVGFFAEVYERYRSEAILLIHYHPERRCYRLVAPEQRITIRVSVWATTTMDEVEYEPVTPQPGWVHVGDIHSHGATMAFQSWTDKEDALYRDGLHIVVGGVRRKKPDFDVAFTVSGSKFELKLEEIVEGFSKPVRPAPRKWLDQVICKTQVAAYDHGYYGGGYGYNGYQSPHDYSDPRPGYDGFGRDPSD